MVDKSIFTNVSLGSFVLTFWKFWRVQLMRPKIIILLKNEFHFALRDRSLFIAGGEGSEDFRGHHFIFRRAKGGISHNWEPQKGDRWKLWKDSEGRPVKFAWKIKTCGGGGGGGSRKSSKVIRWDHFSEVTFKWGDRLNFTLFSPK